MNKQLSEELGRKLYELQARNWPVPIGWDNLGESAQYLWTERALKKHGLVMESKPLVLEKERAEFSSNLSGGIQG